MRGGPVRTSSCEHSASTSRGAHRSALRRSRSSSGAVAREEAREEAREAAREMAGEEAGSGSARRSARTPPRAAGKPLVARPSKGGGAWPRAAERGVSTSRATIAPLARRSSAGEMRRCSPGVPVPAKTGAGAERRRSSITIRTDGSMAGDRGPMVPGFEPVADSTSAGVASLTLLAAQSSWRQAVLTRSQPRTAQSTGEPSTTNTTDLATRLSSAPRPSDSAACAVVWSGPGRTTMSAAMLARARCEARVRRGGQQRSKGQQAQRIGMACMSARAWNAGCAAAAVGCGLHHGPRSTRDLGSPSRRVGACNVLVTAAVTFSDAARRFIGARQLRNHPARLSFRDRYSYGIELSQHLM